MIDITESVGRSPMEQDGVRGTGGAAPGVLAALRAATAARHELLHEIMPLSLDSAAPRDYFAHLAILRDWLEPLEAWLATFSDGPQSPTRSPMAGAPMNRLALIEADLAHETAHETMAPRDRAAVLSSRPGRAWHGEAGVAYRWGVCYVIEGSQLGGAVLYARLKERLAPHPLGYLSAGRDSLGARWRAFQSVMSAEACTPELIDEACRGALEAFDRLIELARRPAPAACVSAA